MAENGNGTARSLIPVIGLPQERFTEEECVKLAEDVAEALVWFEDRKQFHGDVRPQNIFLSGDGRYLLGDPADAGTSGNPAGGYWYMAPEAYFGRPCDGRSDLYSLGITLYWLLNGRRMPFLPLPPAVPATSDYESAKQRRFSGEPVPAPMNGSEGLKRVVLRACAFDPADRYADAAEMLRDLRPAGVQEGPETVPQEEARPEVPQEPQPRPLPQPEVPAAEPQSREQQTGYLPSAGEYTAPADPRPQTTYRAPETAPAAGGRTAGKAKKAAKPARKNNGNGLKLVAVLLIIAGLAALGAALAMPMSRYLKAVKLLKSGSYDEAIQAFREMDGFLDSEKKIRACEYGKAGLLMEDGQYEKAYAAYAALDGFKDSEEKMAECETGLIRNAEIGSTVFFGTYEQDNNPGNGKERIEWTVLAREDGKVLLASRYALDCRQYNAEETEVTWEACGLRQWLNGEFLKEAFSKEEQERIPETEVAAGRNPDHKTDPGNDTRDRVYLLSAKELLRYFPEDGDRSRIPTPYAAANGCFTDETGGCRYWTRTPGNPASKAVFIRINGSMNTTGSFVSNNENGVCPVIWVDLGS